MWSEPMNKVLAIISLGLFGWLGYSVWTGTFEGGYTSKSRALGWMIDMATDRFGAEGASILLFSAGVILAFFFMILHTRAEHAYENDG